MLFSNDALVLSDTQTLDLPPPSLHDLSREGIELLVERGPSFLVNGTVLVTGQIERTTDFEHGMKNQQAEIDGAWQPDPGFTMTRQLWFTCAARGWWC